MSNCITAEAVVPDSTRDETPEELARIDAECQWWQAEQAERVARENAAAWRRYQSGWYDIAF